VIPLEECPAGGAGRSLSGKERRFGTIEPEEAESHVGGCLRAAEEVVELRSASPVGHDHLAVENGLIHPDLGRHLVAERVQAAEDVAIARDETAVAPLEIAQAPEAVVFELEHPAGVIERRFSPGRDDRLHPRKRHPGDMAWVRKRRVPLQSIYWTYWTLERTEGSIKTLADYGDLAEVCSTVHSCSIIASTSAAHSHSGAAWISMSCENGVACPISGTA